MIRAVNSNYITSRSSLSSLIRWIFQYSRHFFLVNIDICVQNAESICGPSYIAASRFSAEFKQATEKKMNATLFPPTIFISFRCINLFAKGFIDQIQYKVAKSHFSQHRIEQHDNVNMKLTTKYTPNSIPLSTVRQKKLYRQNLAYFSPWKIVQEGAKG